MGPNWDLVIDAADPAMLAAFWADMLGYVIEPPPDGFADWPSYRRTIGLPEAEVDADCAIVDPTGRRPRLLFQRVPEAKAGKNRLHLDVPVSAGHDSTPSERIGPQEAARDRLVDRGATEVGAVEEYGGRWIVMRDPEGNEFCLT